MAKRAKTVSWRTLTRRAEKAANKGHLAAARRLRSTAGEVRRLERKVKPAKRKKRSAAGRAAKGWATRRANAVRAHASEVNRRVSNLEASPQNAQQVEVSGRGEIVGGVLSQLADRLAKLARKKGGTDAIQAELMALEMCARHEGCVETDKRATKQLIEAKERVADRIVCAFIAEVDGAMQLHRGLPPSMNWIINSFTLTKIVDALNKAGYRASGKANNGTVMGPDKAS